MSPVLVLYHRNIEQKRYIVNLTESVYLEMERMHWFHDTAFTSKRFFFSFSPILGDTKLQLLHPQQCLKD